MHPAAAELDVEEHVQPLQGDGLDREEVDGEHAVRLRPYELAPGESGTLAGRPQTRLSEELPYGRGGDCQAEPTELAGDPLVAPTRVLTREAEHQRADLAADRRPTSASAVRPATGDQPSVPAQ